MKKLFKLVLVSILVASCGMDRIIEVFPVKLGDKWGYVDSDGKYIINPIYDNAYCFFDGLAMVVKDGKVGYINSSGKEVISPEYKGGTNFSEGKAFVVMDGEPIKCINTSGKELFSLENIEWAYNFHEGLSVIKDTSNRYGFQDPDGKIVIAPRFNNVGSFSEGMAFFQDGSECGYINTKGEVVFNISSDNEESEFCNGLVENVNSTGKFGYLDKSGSIAIPHQFDLATPFKEGLAVVAVGDKFGYIDTKGTIIINPQFQLADQFTDGLARIMQGWRFGFIDSKGAIVHNPIYEKVGPYIGNYAFVSEDGVNYGLINKEGDMVVSPQFQDVRTLSQGNEAVRTGEFFGKRFVPEFLKGKTSDSWDGIHGDLTLGEIMGSYSKAKFSSDSTLVYKPETNAVDGICIKYMIFGFGEKAYKVVTKYESFYGITYKSGTHRQYNNSIKVESLEYVFVLTGTSKSKGKSVATKLSDGLCVLLEESPVSLEERIDFVSNSVSITWSGDTVKVKVVF